MSELAYILLFSTLGSVVSLVGGVILLTNQRWIDRAAHLLVAFAAGALLGTAFLDLLPEAIEQADSTGILTWTVGGILIFFLLEHFLHWFHHGHTHAHNGEAKTVVPLVVISDTVHNFIDGVVIAGTFLVSIPLGITATLAVAAHEIPQEIGDFSILLHQGLTRGRVLALNFLSAVVTVIAAGLTYYAGSLLEPRLPIFLGVTAGFFIYIATSDLIPEIHHHTRKLAFAESLLLPLGVVVIGSLTKILNNL